MSQNVWIKSGEVLDLFPTTGTLITGVSAGAGNYKTSPFCTFQAIVAGSGAVTATILVETSNDNTNWNVTPLGTISITGTAPQADGFTTTAAPWKYVRGRVTAVTGTITSILLKMGV